MSIFQSSRIELGAYRPAFDDAIKAARFADVKLFYFPY